MMEKSRKYNYKKSHAADAARTKTDGQTDRHANERVSFTRGVCVANVVHCAGPAR